MLTTALAHAEPTAMLMGVGSALRGVVCADSSLLPGSPAARAGASERMVQVPRSSDPRMTTGIGTRWSRDLVPSRSNSTAR